MTSELTNASPAAVNMVTNNTLRSGWVEYVEFSWTSVATVVTCTVTIVTAGDTGGGASQTIVAPIAITGTTRVRPRVLPQSIYNVSVTQTNFMERIAIVKDKLVFKAYNAIPTNVISATAKVVLTSQP